MSSIHLPSGDSNLNGDIGQRHSPSLKLMSNLQTSFTYPLLPRALLFRTLNFCPYCLTYAIREDISFRPDESTVQHAWSSGLRSMCSDTRLRLHLFYWSERSQKIATAPRAILYLTVGLFRGSPGFHQTPPFFRQSCASCNVEHVLQSATIEICRIGAGETLSLPKPSKLFKLDVFICRSTSYVAAKFSAVKSLALAEWYIADHAVVLPRPPGLEGSRIFLASLAHVPHRYRLLQHPSPERIVLNTWRRTSVHFRYFHRLSMVSASLLRMRTPASLQIV
ncbi:hypothetical protein B0H15DRAFT_67292 [Mycena belliarum]|uniref:Uncharacterized protein n=1 Tax=Mycena belliarum TaxID=1033014 RepID=A0AAD6UA06_9AGAR|nr:hypothetical protein B0H15DRAFT_67292 [Mycena belliae]